MLKMSRARALGALLVVLAASLAISACGGGVPGNSVATVGDQTIKRSTFDHWMQIIAISQAGQTNPANAKDAKVPDAPDFEQCVATKKKTAAKPAKGQPEPTEAQFKTQCKQQYDQFKNEVLGFLIRSTWLDQEAKEQKVNLTAKQVQKEIDDIKKQQFTQKGSYEKFLVQAGLTNEDVLFQQRVRDLQTKITAKVTKGKNTVTDAQIADYYNKHKSQFATPERRDVRIVLTKAKDRAEAAKKALEGGQSWKSVAKEFSIDQASKSKGGELEGGVAQGQQEKALDTAIFAAKRNALTGPVKTQFGWYVIEVTKINKGKQQSLEQSKAQIKQVLQQQNQNNALKKFGDDYRKRYKKTTDCRKGYEVDDCKNAPKKKAPTAPTQTTPGQNGGGAQEQPQPSTTSP